MIELAKHLWWQLLHDEEAAKNRLAALKSSGVALALQLSPMLLPNVHYHWSQWLAAIIGTLYAGGATAIDPTRLKGQALTPGDSQKAP